MVTTALAWNSSMDNSLSIASPTAQYQDALFKLHTMLLTPNSGAPFPTGPGWSLVFSAGNNMGAGFAADSNNNIGQASDIVQGPDNNTANTSYAVYQSHANYGDNGGTLYFMWVARYTTSPDDRTVNFYGLVAPNSYSLHGTPAWNRPVPSSAPGENNINIFIRTASVVPAPETCHMWWTDRGEWMWGVSLDGSLQLETLVWAYSPDSGEGINDFGVFCMHQSAGAPHWVRFTNVNSHMGWFIDGIASTTGEPTMLSPAERATAWQNGNSNAGNNPLKAQIDLVCNSGTQGRYLGRIVDVRGVPDLTPILTVSATEVLAGDPVVYASVGGLAIPTVWAQISGGVTF